MVHARNINISRKFTLAVSLVILLIAGCKSKADSGPSEEEIRERVDTVIVEYSGKPMGQDLLDPIVEILGRPSVSHSAVSAEWFLMAGLKCFHFTVEEGYEKTYSSTLSKLNKSSSHFDECVAGSKQNTTAD